MRHDLVGSVIVLGVLVCFPVQGELVAFWPLDTSAEDVVGGHHGEPNGGVDFGGEGATPNTGMSATFSEGGIDIELSDQLNPESYTFVAWARTFAEDGNPYSVVTSREDLGPGEELYGYILYQINGNWSHWTGDGDLGCGDGDCWDILDGDFAEVDEWQHLAISYDADSEVKSLFIDGALFADADDQIYVPNTTRDLHIGSGAELGEVFRFFGDIDDAALFNTALSEADIQNIMTNGVASLIGGDPLDPLNNGTLTDPTERANYVRDVLGTWVGDSNLDGEFNSGDFVFVFTAGEYEDAVEGNSSWATGDWNGDRDFDSSDFVAAFTDGGFELGPRGAVSAVPEPSALVFILIAVGCLPRIIRAAR